jgi:hypothetical protein
MDGFRIAFWTYVLPMMSLRAIRIGLFLLLGLVGLVALAIGLGAISKDATDAMLLALRGFVVFPGVPIGAILLSEMPLRDGIRHRTLLYPLLGPVPRPLLAVVRTLATGGVLAIGAVLGYLLLYVFLREGNVGRDVLAVTLGSIAYVSVFGLVHLVSDRGLTAGLAVFALLDWPIGLLPLQLRNVSVSYHLKVIADRDTIMQLPISIGLLPAQSLALSCVLILALGAVFLALTAYLFQRRNLGEIC